MSIRNLNHMFRPKSVAVIGASIRPQSVGATVMRNLLAGGFEGPIMPVNPKYEAVCGILTYPSVAELPRTPDLAVICTPPKTVPTLVAELSERGTKAAVVLTAGLEVIEESTGKSIQQSMLEASGSNMLRVLGPNCVGLIISPRSTTSERWHSSLPGKTNRRPWVSPE